MGGGANKLYFALSYVSTGREIGGKAREGFSLSENHTSCK
ncbi:hypothetical protein LEP1GSC036_3018 [Leptospira weilii str. 2006001853]|uniref:Uncharacterized protein n=2 Tax=Leptospira weilii TaxID=28184 RepID=A0A828YZA8_9LEPT|nr:hypothetical protein LEP1GSC036_3018 [Leptospira weilii str. 2006001853]EMM74190.1 hypothetical protein LEP1GSC038_3194 [Leptospira weilii str. 2006001855]EMN43106.1 hypothetical protein LEP1GSC086_0454 [Leptospira weilii str. LNT 1234]